MSSSARGPIARKHKCTTKKSRKRINMSKIEDRASRQTTFSKRRTGFFKKSAQLAALCGAEVATIVFSPYGRPFVFGYPSVDTVISCFEGASTSTALHGGQDRNSDETETSAVVQSNSIGYNNSPCHTDLTLGVGGNMGLVREEEVEAAAATKGESKGFWWDQPTDKMNLQQLKEFRASLQKLKEDVGMHLDETTIRKVALRDFLGVN